MAINLIEIASNGFRFVLFDSDGVAKRLAQGELWEPHFLKIASAFVRAGDSVCDAGANFGYHTAHLSRLVGTTGKVFAFEPQRIVFQQLNYHLFANLLTNVFAFPVALGAEPGTTSVPEIHEVNLANVGATAVGHGSNTVEVKHLDEYSAQRFSFIKIDVQGCETALLRGSEEILNRDKPLLFLEIEENWLKNFGTSSKELIELVLARGYSLLRIETEWPSDHLCFPNERKSEILSRISELGLKTTLIEGKTVELIFSTFPYYDSIVVS